MPSRQRNTAALSAHASLSDLQRVVRQIYGQANERWFDLTDLATNVSRFTMRTIKAVRKSETAEDFGRVEMNLAISLSWLASMSNRLHQNLDDVTWRRFPYRCATCHHLPCSCGDAGAIDVSKAPAVARAVRPQALSAYQQMFQQIYPASGRSLDHAAIHLVEEVGELEEAVLMYRTRHRDADLRQIDIETADYLSCSFGLLNSIDARLERPETPIMSSGLIMASLFEHNCHACGSVPCKCSYDKVINYNLGDRW